MSLLLSIFPFLRASLPLIEKKEKINANQIKELFGSAFHKRIFATTPIITTIPRKNFLLALESAYPPRIGPKIATINAAKPVV